MTLTSAEEINELLGPQEIDLKVKKTDPDASIPTYATDGSGCMDLYALIQNEDATITPPRSAQTYNTGISAEVPAGFVMLIFSRSGHGFKHGIRLANCVGVIDSDYRGEIAVRLTNDGEEPFHVNNGDRIAQAMLIRAPKIKITEVSELSETDRGAGGFGSTGT